MSGRSSPNERLHIVMTFSSATQANVAARAAQLREAPIIRRRTLCDRSALISFEHQPVWASMGVRDSLLNSLFARKRAKVAPRPIWYWEMRPAVWKPGNNTVSRRGNRPPCLLMDG
jgi:hypothetical protein